MKRLNHEHLYFVDIMTKDYDDIDAFFCEAETVEEIIEYIKVTYPQGGLYEISDVRSAEWYFISECF